MIEPDKRYTTQVNGKTVVVLVVECEQDINRDRRKWVCRSEATGRPLRRTSRQLHPLAEQA